jgi:hypothetical protein
MRSRNPCTRGSFRLLLKRGCRNIWGETRFGKPFGLINDMEHHVHLFIDRALTGAEKLTFHPNDNRATLVISSGDFFKFLEYTGNSWELIDCFTPF